MPYGRYWHSVSFDLPTQNATNICTVLALVGIIGVVGVVVTLKPGGHRFHMTTMQAQ